LADATACFSLPVSDVKFCVTVSDVLNSA
jgi:hypothetical protein